MAAAIDYVVALLTYHVAANAASCCLTTLIPLSLYRNSLKRSLYFQTTCDGTTLATCSQIR